ncbi:MAG: hypothetical protein HYT98_02360 [Candidatus Sungbacteria bacterium]|nr:hypothetical protein [Candidatus Sungbacteria bacterium]
MTRQCQNCNQSFEIAPEDLSFYDRIHVPPPTWCPRCRFQRRLAFFNLTALYKRKCDLCGEEKISIYRPDAPYRVYCPPCWWSDKWDPMQYGRDYDFSRSFFEQYADLVHEVPHCGLATDHTTVINSTYTNHAGNLKNCYLLFQADFNEDCAHGVYVKNSRSTLDSSLILKSELCYDSMHSYKNSHCAGLRSQVTNSLDCYFLKDSFNCQYCFASANLRNRKHVIFNKQYSPEDYFKEIARWDLGSYAKYQEIKCLAEAHWKTLPPKPHMDDFSVNSSGSHYFQCKNCKDCFEVWGEAEDSKFLFMLSIPPLKDCYDVSTWGNNLQLSYESYAVGEQGANLKFCAESGINAHLLEYCKFTFGGVEDFGCVGLRKKQYCILNKQYTKEEYEKMVPKIKKHMDEMPYISEIRNPKHEIRKIIYKYGEFFPIELSPFPYNDTVAHNFFPLTKEDALARGYKWGDKEKRAYPITIKASDLPDHIKDAPGTILQEVIECVACGRGFRIIPMEFKFLRKMNLPLPRQCPFCRIDEKFTLWVKDLRVIPRTCDKCGTSLTTNYTQEEAPVIYCKACYNNEVI